MNNKTQTLCASAPLRPCVKSVFVLENHTGITDDNWCLIAPFGEWPKTRLYREDNQVKQQQFIQVVDDAAADALVSRENSLFGRLKRAFIGVPVYKGHGDLADVDPQAISGGERKIKLGIVDQLRKTPRGLEAHFALDPDGAAAVQAGWKFPSSFWYVQPLPNSDLRPLTSGSAIRCRPFKLISVALTPFPNISGVESLANSAGAPAEDPTRSPSPTTPDNKSRSETGAPPLPLSPTTTTNQEQDMKLIIGWLLAQGTVLANTENPSETQVLAALQQLHTAKTADVAALGNTQQTLTGKITALETERDALRQRAEDATTALSSEKAARTAERQGRAEAIVDLAIHRGQATVAQRDAHAAALSNSADFTSAAAALLASPVVIKTVGQDTQSGKQSAGLANEQQQLQAEYTIAFQTELIASGQNPARAHNNIMTLPKYAGLAQKLLPKQM